MFDNAYARSVWRYIKDSHYVLGWADDEILEHSQYVCLHSRYSAADIEYVGLLKKVLESPAGKHVKGMCLEKTIVNLAVPGQTFFEHTHSNAPHVCLYYANLEWKREWGGETLFYTDDNKKLEKAIEYKPNRLVLFNGDKPHSIRPATYQAPFYRFSISMFFIQQGFNLVNNG